MDKNKKNEIINLLVGKKINKIEFVRGLGIVPAKFVIKLEDNHRYDLEVESNFRILYNQRIICSFEDLFMTIDKKTISKKKYQEQKDIEFTYLSKALEDANLKCANMQITNCRITSYGDCILSLGRGISLHMINDNQYDNYTIFSLYDIENKTIFKSENGIEFERNKKVYELKIIKNKAEIVSY